MGNFLNKITNGIGNAVNSVGNYLGMGAPGGNLLGSAINQGVQNTKDLYNGITGQNPVSPAIAPTQQQTTVSAPVVTSAPTPTIPRINPVNPTPFKLDTSNITSDHFGTNNSYGSVIASSQSPLASSLATYQSNAPTPSQYAQTTLYTPEQMAANQNVLQQQQIGRQIQQNYLGGVQNVMGRPEAMDFQQGQEAALTRQNALLGGQQALNTEAATAQANYMEQIRQNNIAALNAQQTGAQNQFANQLSAANYGLSAQQVGQSRYDIQSNPSDPTKLLVLDKTNPAGGYQQIDTNSNVGQQLLQSQNQTNPQAGIIGGYDLSSYATKGTPADPNYKPGDTTAPQDINSWYTAINNAVQGIGGVKNIDTASQIISQISPNSPVTGAMVISSANKYGVDPALIISVMQNDSQLGTTGKGAKTFNPGNVGNNDAGQIKNFGSWNKGVDAVAEWLSNHKAQNQQQTGQPVTLADKTLVSNPFSISQVQQLPQNQQQYLAGGPQGMIYVDASRVPASLLPAIKINASRAGIPVLDEASASGVKSLDVVYKNLENMNTLASTVLGNRLQGLTTNPLQAQLQSGEDVVDPITGETVSRGVLLNRFNSYRATAIKSVQGLAGGAGSGLRINTGEISAESDNLPTLGDSKESALAKISQYKTFLNNQLSETFPVLRPENQIQTQPQAMTKDGAQWVLGNDGLYYPKQ